MSNLEAVIGPLRQDECLSKRPWQGSIQISPSAWIMQALRRTVPYRVMRIDFLRWISLIIRCSLDVVVGAQPQRPTRVCDTGPFVLNWTPRARKKQEFQHHRDQVRFDRWLWSFLLSLIYSYAANTTTPHLTFVIYRPLNCNVATVKTKHSWNQQWKACATKMSHGVSVTLTRPNHSYWLNKKDLFKTFISWLTQKCVALANMQDSV